jgi:hypothetical protein
VLELTVDRTVLVFSGGQMDRGGACNESGLNKDVMTAVDLRFP